jgi:MerR family transcriptional regulator, light-induced transcriptional regulator
MHELGALMAAFIAAAEGWNTIYFGADTPADEIAAPAARTRASAISIFYTRPVVGAKAYELKRLRRQFKPHVALLFGGGGRSPSHRS